MYGVEPHAFTTDLQCHLRNSLRPVIPDNAWILRMTAAAGTELADPYSSATVITGRKELRRWQSKSVVKAFGSTEYTLWKLLS